MLRTLLIALSSSVAIATANAAPNVVVSIKPIHSLTAGVMKGIGEPTLLLDGTTSPHDFSLKPSQAQSLQDSDVIIWIGEGLETFLVKSMQNQGNDKISLELMDVEGVSLLEYREHDHHDHEKHDDHDDHEDEDHSEHKHDDEHGHKEEDHAEHKHEEDHDDGHDHAAGGKDAHLWLDIDNAKVITNKIAKALSSKDAENANTYKANAKSMIEKLNALDTKLGKIMQGSQDKEYVVFHDAYQYFEKHFGLAKPLAITLNPEVQPSAARVKEIQDEVSEHKITCMFSEPQFSPKVLSVVAENTSASISTLDPLGSAVEKGEEHYFKMMNTLATSLSNCLKK